MAVLGTVAVVMQRSGAGDKIAHTEVEELTFRPKRIFIRAFKQEAELEIWAAPDTRSPLSLVKKYPVARLSGKPGPKRKEGDRQVPEGIYHIDRFNPNSNFHLSLGLNYPNKADRILGHPETPGTDIFIHGSNVSIGCLAMTDPIIEEIYSIALEAKARRTEADTGSYFSGENDIGKHEAAETGVCRKDRCSRSLGPATGSL